ncbi:hypothetical protein KIPB_003677 [Kipferlia bialata]|uniref:Uncharacterized protein n=1 Tax=Kipferlia bialata TaxID=797122 RepID=A0A9K3CTS8_9EUKA|nr:hypothetical protein KIPB_003677 [Kipferlia bialata]|eukprot:g3677.t1
MGAAITALSFVSAGQLLVTGDASGTLVVWQERREGRKRIDFGAVQQASHLSKITHIVPRAPSSAYRTGDIGSGDGSPVDVIVGFQSGSVFLVSVGAHNPEDIAFDRPLCKLTGRIAALMYMPVSDTLVALSESGDVVICALADAYHQYESSQTLQTTSYQLDLPPGCVAGACALPGSERVAFLHGSEIRVTDISSLAGCSIILPARGLGVSWDSDTATLVVLLETGSLAFATECASSDSGGHDRDVGIGSQGCRTQWVLSEEHPLGMESNPTSLSVVCGIRDGLGVTGRSVAITGTRVEDTLADLAAVDLPPLIGAVSSALELRLAGHTQVAVRPGSGYDPSVSSKHSTPAVLSAGCGVCGLSCSGRYALVHGSDTVLVLEGAGRIGERFAMREPVDQAVIVGEEVVALSQGSVLRCSLSGSGVQAFELPDDSRAISICAAPCEPVLGVALSNGSVLVYNMRRRSPQVMASLQLSSVALRGGRAQLGPYLPVQAAVSDEGTLAVALYCTHPATDIFTPSPILAVCKGDAVTTIDLHDRFVDGLAFEPGREAAVVLSAPLGVDALYLADTDDGAGVRGTAKHLHLLCFREGDATAVLGETMELPHSSCSLAGSTLHSTGGGSIVTHTGVERVTFPILAPVATDPSALDPLLGFTACVGLGDTDAAYAMVAGISSPRVWRTLIATCIRYDRPALVETCIARLESPTSALLVRSNPAETLGLAALVLGRQDFPSHLGANAADTLLDCGLHTESLRHLALDGRLTRDTVLHCASKRLNLLGDAEGSRICQDHSIRPKERDSLAVSAPVSTDTGSVPGSAVSLGVRSSAVGVNESRSALQKVDPELVLVAQTTESQLGPDAAAPLYRAAGSISDAVRCVGKSDSLAAADEAERDGSSPALLEAALALERDRHWERAARILAAAGRLSHSCRTAMRAGMDDLVFRLASEGQAPVSLVSEAAAYLGQKTATLEQALTLLQRTGQVCEAAELALSAGLVTPLIQLARQLSVGSGSDRLTDPTRRQVLSKVGDFLAGHGHASEAVLAYAHVGQQQKALSLVESADIVLSDALIETLVPPKPKAKGQPSQVKERKEVLVRIARLLVRQRSFQQAAKLFTVAGDRMSAVQTLIRSGDVSKVVYYASVARTRDVYLQAAHYLQTLDWREDPELLKRITQFYVKAKAEEGLARFFSSCAKNEVDDWRCYEKALDAQREALRWIKRSKAPSAAQEMAKMQRSAELLESFLGLRALSVSDPSSLIREADALLAQEDCEDAVHAGDVLALLVEHLTQTGDIEGAVSQARRMLQRGIDMSLFLSPEVVESLGLQVEHSLSHDDGDGMDEEVLEAELSDQELSDQLLSD